MSEEPSMPPVSETHKRREVERVYEAVLKERDIGQTSTYKRKERMLIRKGEQRPKKTLGRSERGMRGRRQLRN